MTRFVADALDIGRTCPYCRFLIKEEARAERCDACSAVHHADCWEDGDGCAVLGCRNNAASREMPPTSKVLGGPTQTLGHAQTHLAPAPIGKPPGPTPAKTAPAGKSPTKALFAVAVTASILVVAVLAIGIVRLAGDSSRQTPSSASSEMRPENSSHPTDDSSTAADARKAKGSILSTLRRYQEAYSAQNPGLLRTVYTRTVSRYGNVAGSCERRYGIREVIDASGGNMDGQRYELVPLRPSTVRLIGSGGRNAVVDTNYSFGGGQPHRIHFVLVRTSGGGWRVSKVDAYCGGREPF